jgi:hypothetical protein
MSSPFEKLLGVTPELLILEEILCPPCDYNFTINDIYTLTEIPIKKIKKVIKKFLKWGIITKFTKLDGPLLSNDTTPLVYYDEITTYKLNFESPYVKAIIAFNNALIEDAIGEEGLYEIHDYLEEQAKNLKPVKL